MHSIKILILSALIGSGCTSKVIVKQPPLPLPNRPALPILTNQENLDFKKFNLNTYKKILKRESLRKIYIQQLEAIIKSTH